MEKKIIVISFIAGFLGLVLTFTAIQLFVIPQVKASPDNTCTVNDTLEVNGSLEIRDDLKVGTDGTGILYLNGVPRRTSCGTCSDGNKGEIVICKEGGECSGWGLEICIPFDTDDLRWKCLST